MKPALLTHMHIPRRGVEACLESLRGIWDGEVIVLGVGQTWLRERGMPHRNLADFQTREALLWAEAQAAACKERILNALDSIPEIAEADNPYAKLRTFFATQGAENNPNWLLHLEQMNLLLRLAASKTDLRLILLQETNHPISKMLLLSGRQLGIPSMELVHGIPGPNNAFESRVAAADYVAVYSEYVKRQYIAYGAAPERVFVTGNPAWDQYNPIPCPLQRKRLCREMNLNPDAPIVVYGMIHTESTLYLDSLSVALEAFKRLARRMPQGQFLIREHPMGFSNPNYQVDRIRGMMESCAQEGTARFMMDASPTADMLKVADVVVVPTESGLCADAILSGLPVVIENDPSFRMGYFPCDLAELWGDENAFLRARSSAALEECVERALSCSETRARLLRARPDAVRAINHATDRQASKRVVRLMRDIMDKGRRGLTPVRRWPEFERVLAETAATLEGPIAVSGPAAAPLERALLRVSGLKTEASTERIETLEGGPYGLVLIAEPMPMSTEAERRLRQAKTVLPAKGRILCFFRYFKSFLPQFPNPQEPLPLYVPPAEGGDASFAGEGYTPDAIAQLASRSGLELAACIPVHRFGRPLPATSGASSPLGWVVVLGSASEISEEDSGLEQGVSAADALNRLGEKRFGEGEVKEALRIFLDAHRQCPANARYLNNIAATLTALNAPDQAWDYLIEALHHDPKSEEVRENLSILAEMLQRAEALDRLLLAADGA